jgi:hypothetical protein
VPTGFYFVLTRLMQTYLPPAAGMVQGSGDVLWDVVMNPGAQNLTVEGLAQVPFPLGSNALGFWWELPCPEIFESGDTVRSQVTTTADITPGSPNFFATIFGGYLEPAAGEE